MGKRLAGICVGGVRLRHGRRDFLLTSLTAAYFLLRQLGTPLFGASIYNTTNANVLASVASALGGLIFFQWVLQRSKNAPTGHRSQEGELTAQRERRLTYDMRGKGSSAPAVTKMLTGR